MLKLAFFMLMVAMGTSDRMFWRCSGPETKSADCETNTKKMLSDDCYFLPHFQQYRPCSAICNDVVFGSIDEERCRGYCPGKIT